MQMPGIDEYEQEVLGAFDKGRLKSVATKGELAKFKAAARATAIKDRRVNIRLSSGDLSDIQVKALEEGVPYRRLSPMCCTSTLPAAWRNGLRVRPVKLAPLHQNGAPHPQTKFF